MHPSIMRQKQQIHEQEQQNSLTLKRQVIAVQCFHVKPRVTLKCKGPLRGQRVGEGGWWASVHGAVARTCAASRLQGKEGGGEGSRWCAPSALHHFAACRVPLASPEISDVRSDECASDRFIAASAERGGLRQGWSTWRRGEAEERD